MNVQFAIGTDIGGSHISSALVNLGNGEVLQSSYFREDVNTDQSAGDIMNQWIQVIHRSIEASKITAGDICGVGIAMPGPFDYEKGISRIWGVNKFQSIYGLNLKQVLRNRLSISEDPEFVFENDASCFGIGESRVGGAASHSRIIAVTLGTGIGATFLIDHAAQKTGEGVPPDGYLYNTTFKNGVAEDYLSARWLVNEYNARAGANCTDSKDIYRLAVYKHDALARKIFNEFAENLASCLLPWIKAFNAGSLIIGGSISKAAELILPILQDAIGTQGTGIHIQVSGDTEISAIRGAASLVTTPRNRPARNKHDALAWRKSRQPLMPMQMTESAGIPGKYDLYPFTSLGPGKIAAGYESLAEWMANQGSVLIDGYAGVDWDVIRDELDAALKRKGIKSLWFEMSAFEKSTDEIERMVAPWLGEEGSVWGRKTTLGLENFYDIDAGRLPQLASADGLNILIGVGAALVMEGTPLVYVDLPKNELQYRMRAGSICNLGRRQPEAVTDMYKRFYFVDWVVLNNHKEKILPAISVIADGQWKNDLTWMRKEIFIEGLDFLAHNIIRVRPWFEAGAWGGQWCKKHIPLLNPEEVNYAWSFELIVPENGIVFQSSGYLLEVSFDWLMFNGSAAVLGKHAARFGNEFPIRFDFLDTVDGGNLSIQCHPSLSYIREHFGERITQDETYYILDCTANARVYLGLQEGIDMPCFKQTLQKSIGENMPLDIELFVQSHPAEKHDLFLIPNGTVHSAGAGNLVLEISATPYIFTFKMYDWLRPDLDGAPRPINIEHAFNNLDEDRRGEMVKQTLISRPALLEKGNDWQVLHLPTHAVHFYDVHRLEFNSSIEVQTGDRFHVLMLVEGSSVSVETKAGVIRRFNYAETFVIPAAAISYKITYEGRGTAKMVKAFVK